MTRIIAIVFAMLVALAVALPTDRTKRGANNKNQGSQQNNGSDRRGKSNSPSSSTTPSSTTVDGNGENGSDEIFELNDDFFKNMKNLPPSMTRECKGLFESLESHRKRSASAPNDKSPNFEGNFGGNSGGEDSDEDDKGKKSGDDDSKTDRNKSGRNHH